MRFVNQSGFGGHKFFLSFSGSNNILSVNESGSLLFESHTV